MEVRNPLSISYNDNDRVPLRKWWDGIQKHFVALIELSEESATFQILSVPALQSNIIAHLTAGAPFTIAFPSSLLRNEKGAQKMPLLVKISLDREILAVQFSPTLIRIVPVAILSYTTSNYTLKHWTIDLSIDTAPITTSSTSLASKGFHLNLTRATSEMLDESLYWGQHEGNSQDLIIVTTRAVLCYKVSVKRNQMAPTYSLYQQQSSSDNTCAWWEPKTQCLIVGARERMSPYLFWSSQQAASAASAFPRLELPPPGRVPTFALQGDARHLFLVNVYGDPCLVEFRETVVDFYFFDARQETRLKMVALSEPFLTTASDTLFASVVDNILCLTIYQRPETVLLVDAKGEFNLVVPNLIGGPSSRITKKSSEKIFLEPRYVLENDDIGQQRLCASYLDLETVGSYCSNKASMISFMLRRVENSKVAHSQILKELSELLDQQVINRRRPSNELGGVSRYDWVETVFMVYQQSPAEMKGGNESLSLIIKCSLLHVDTERKFLEEYADVETQTRKQQPGTALTQSEILAVLLEQANNGLKNDSKAKLRLVCDSAVEILSAVTQHSFRPCLALYALIVALLWRLNHIQELLAVLRSIAEEDSSVDSEGYDVLSEMVISIATGVKIGCTRKVNTKVKRSRKEELIFEQLLVTLSAISSPSMLAKQLLRRGQITKAVELCTKVARQLKESKENEGSAEGCGSSLDHARTRIKVNGDAFFRAAIVQASSEMSIGERCRIFCYLHHFLQTWHPECLLPYNHNTDARQKSQFERSFKNIDNDLSTVALAATVKDFPDHLFGGANSHACRKVKDLFGY